MAMTVALTFEDDEIALEFIEYAQKGLIVGCNSQWPEVEQSFSPEIKALYKHPTMFCECQSGRKTEVGFTRGVKWGWWVCGQCSKPKRLYWENIFEHNGFGNNIFSRYFDDTDEESKPVEGSSEASI